VENFQIHHMWVNTWSSRGGVGQPMYGQSIPNLHPLSVIHCVTFPLSLFGALHGPILLETKAIIDRTRDTDMW